MIANDPIEHLIGLLSRLPGLGRRSARRAVLKMLMDPAGRMLPLAEALQHAAEAVRPCETCGNLDTASPCGICRDAHRDRRLVCVVEGVADLWALERAHAHRGTYHVLGGLLSALGGTGPEDLSIAPLLRRIEEDGIEEVILALPATVDGATTAHYLTDRLKPTGTTVTRLAQGVPIGGALDVLDDGTLAAAFKARRPL
ncbi:recombination protein RecR [Roseomonas alkaliterrae]|uniref:Recombination protein RecR n=1 Tax=Neoroseomonas alkaliterrae TaxID=1452450 RepID=A0A840XNX1_9PROT|nr:recombination mediator RecR [Neoroseomonas alkaliterrae]MBB5688470.1 recombination protein RecR [Neoroseomonas alkaliterrae]MBR0677458.1 recombination protein RecR [Neoroseomonas alkaliterrae]